MSIGRIPITAIAIRTPVVGIWAAAELVFVPN
jgi:hypothetical protein